MAKKELNYINTNSLWEEMSYIAQSALSDIENVLTESEEEIETSFGTIYYDKEEEEPYIRDKEGEETPLREEDTQQILYIADEINDWIANYHED